jgi:hypothetical protein
MRYFHHSVKEVLIVKPTGNKFEQMTIEALNRCLQNVPFAHGATELAELKLVENPRPDLIAKVKLTDGEKWIIVEFKTLGEPRIARGAINQLLQYKNKLPDAYGVFAAPYISPKAAQVCIDEGIGYMDLAGNCHISFGQIYIEKSGNLNPFSDKRDLRSLYSPKSTRILRVLLSNPKTAWRLQRLAVVAGVSLGLVAKVKSLLADREWITEGEEGMRLVDPEARLIEWAHNYSYRKNVAHNYYSLKTAPENEAYIAEVLSKKGIRYALTGFSGADRLAPFMRYSRMTAYVDVSDEDVTESLNLKKVTSGANVTLLTPYDEGVYYGSRELNGIQVASPIQVYLDLAADRGRGEEAAKELMEKVIRPSW